MDIYDLCERIKKLDRRIYGVFGVDQDEDKLTGEIEQLEKSLNFTLSPDMKEYIYKGLNGLVIEAKEEFWPTAKVGDIRQFWTHLNGICLLGLGEEIPEEYNVWFWLNWIGRDGATGLVPFMYVLNDYHCVYCFDEHGRIQEYFFGDESGPVDTDFYTLVKKEIDELEERQEQLSRGEGLIHTA